MVSAEYISAENKFIRFLFPDGETSLYFINPAFKAGSYKKKIFTVFCNAV